MKKEKAYLRADVTTGMNRGEADFFIFDGAGPVLAEGESKARPLISVSIERVQTLMNDLWRGGVRPSNYIEPTPQTISILDRHIADLRQNNNDLRQMLFMATHPPPDLPHIPVGPHQCAGGPHPAQPGPVPGPNPKAPQKG